MTLWAQFWLLFTSSVWSEDLKAATFCSWVFPPPELIIEASAVAIVFGDKTRLLLASSILSPVSLVDCFVFDLDLDLDLSIKVSSILDKFLVSVLASVI